MTICAHLKGGTTTPVSYCPTVLFSSLGNLGWVKGNPCTTRGPYYPPSATMIQLTDISSDRAMTLFMLWMTLTTYF